jgi:hypothetical protein
VAHHAVRNEVPRAGRDVVHGELHA